MTECSSKLIDLVVKAQMPILFVLIFVPFGVFFLSYQMQSIALLGIIVILLGVSCWHYKTKIYPKTIEFMNRHSNTQPPKFHHAIIIAHKKIEISWTDYICGIDILIERFSTNDPPVPFRIYDVASKEDVLNCIFDPDTQYLWIFGHGQRNKLKISGKKLCYADIRDAPKKLFVGQYHCNSPIGTSLADMTNASESDVTKFLRFTPEIRNAVSRQLNRMEIGK
ncbi:MAG: hypothetical protein JXA08_03895 [Methanomicrobiaceae archaeon]|nr:hypothetical protein [Methanomicrobiaceae archaeon]